MDAIYDYYLFLMRARYQLSARELVLVLKRILIMHCSIYLHQPIKVVMMRIFLEGLQSRPIQYHLSVGVPPTTLGLDGG